MSGNRRFVHVTRIGTQFLIPAAHHKPAAVIRRILRYDTFGGF